MAIKKPISDNLPGVEVRPSQADKDARQPLLEGKDRDGVSISSSNTALPLSIVPNYAYFRADPVQAVFNSPFVASLVLAEETDEAREAVIKKYVELFKKLS